MLNNPPTSPVTHVVERAIELGYNFDCCTPKSLGSFIKVYLTPLPHKIHYNGFEVNAYPRSLELDEKIHLYFEIVKNAFSLVDFNNW